MRFHLLNASPRPPFVDWCADISRHIHALTGQHVVLDPGRQLIGAYNCGLSAREIAEDWAAWQEHRS